VPPLLLAPWWGVRAWSEDGSGEELRGDEDCTEEDDEDPRIYSVLQGLLLCAAARGRDRRCPCFEPAAVARAVVRELRATAAPPRFEPAAPPLPSALLCRPDVHAAALPGRTRYKSLLPEVRPRRSAATAWRSVAGGPLPS